MKRTEIRCREMRMKNSTLNRSLYFGLLPLFVFVVIILVAWHREAGNRARHVDPKHILQFTSNGHVVGFASDGIYAVGGSHALHIEFAGRRLTKPVSDVASSDAHQIRSLSKVTYRNLWDGVTLSYDLPKGAIARSTYRVEPQAEVNSIRLRYNAPVSVQGNGTLRIDFKSGWMSESAPQAWQESNGRSMPVQIAFVSRGEKEIGFAVGDYDRSQALFIDPTLAWNTFLGAGQDFGFAVALDGSGNVYVAGESFESWGSPIRPYSAGADGFVAKLDTNGNLIWNTFLGSSTEDLATGIGVDVLGNVYVTGPSNASWGSPIRAFAGTTSTFVAKLDTNGNLIWNTFLGGPPQFCVSNALTLDVLNNVYVAGYSSNSWGSPVNPYAGGFDAFVAKLNSSGDLIWNTFAGSSDADVGEGIAVALNGNVYVTGVSNATWGSPIRPFPADAQDVFAAKLDPNGNLVWNTFFPGTESHVTVDASENVYVLGSTTTSWGSPVRPFQGSGDGYIARLDSNGTLIWNTFVGGAGSDEVHSVTVDLSGNIYVAGNSLASWGSPAPPFSGGSSGQCSFAAEVDPNGNLVWNGFLGDGSVEGQAVAVDSATNVYLVGSSVKTWGAPVRPFTPTEDAYAAKLVPGVVPTPTPTPTASPTPTATPTPTVTPTPTATPTPSSTPTPTPNCQFTTSISMNFNGTLIPSGSSVWFNSVLKPSGLGSSPVTFRFTAQTITGPDFTVLVPDAVVTFDPAATSATTTFSGGMWVTRVPSSGLAGNTFFSAVSFQVPTNISGGVKNIVWSGIIVSDTFGTSLQWQWGGAVYSAFSSDYNALGVKPVDDNKASQYKNSDHAGTPENFKPYVIGGGTGGGGANYTGGYSGTASVGPCH